MRNLPSAHRVGVGMRHAPLAALAVTLATAGTATALTRGAPSPALPVDAGPAPWEQPFSLVAGGGTRRPADGLVAGLADLGRVWGGARDGGGRVVVATTTGTWIVGVDGRLARLRGLTPEAERPRYQEVPPLGLRALAALPDGRVAIADDAGRRVVALVPGTTKATPLATADGAITALGHNEDGALVAVARGRVLRLRHGALAPADDVRSDVSLNLRVGGIGAVPGGLLVAQGSSNEPEADVGQLDLLGADGRRTRLDIPSSNASLRGVAVLPDGRALLATNLFSNGELDRVPLALAAGKTLDRQSFDYGVGEEYYGWISRRRTLLRLPGGDLRRVRWAGPPADAIAPDGSEGNVLVASAGRLWSTRGLLGAPDVSGFDERQVGIQLSAPAVVTVTARVRGGEISVASGPTSLPAGRSVVTLPQPGPGLNRVTVTARTATMTTVTGAWALDASEYSVARAQRVLAAIARRLNIGFEGYLSHGVDRCRSAGPNDVVCRWSSGGLFADGAPATEREVRVTRSPAGYAILAGPRRPSPERGRNRRLLGAPFDASA